MHPSTKAPRSPFVMLCALCCMALVSVTAGPGAAAPLSTGSENPVPVLLQQMDGTWNVQQKMWPQAGAEPVDLPPAVARRRIVGQCFLEEIMEAKTAPGSKSDPFTRIAYLNYNAVNQQYEYLSLDTRAPQIMNERSYEAGRDGNMPAAEAVVLYGGSFVAPRWGETANAAFRYRLAIQAVVNDRQIIQLYLTPLSGEKLREFVAFEYVYTRRN